MFGNIFQYILQGKTYPTCIPFKPRAFPTSQRHNSNFRSHQPRSNRRWTFMKTPRSIMHPSTTMELAYNILELAVRRRGRMKAIWNRWKIRSQRIQNYICFSGYGAVNHAGQDSSASGPNFYGYGRT